MEQMRIRNRSCSAVLLSRKSCEKPLNRTFTDEVEDEEEKFLLPLVAAAMDAQQPEEDDQVDAVGALTIPGTETATGTGIVGRRAGHKWRDILLRHGAGNAESCEAIEVGSWEGEKTKFKGNKIMRNKREKVGFLGNEGKSRAVLEDENTSNSCCEESGSASDYRERDSAKSGRPANDFMSKKLEQEAGHFVERGNLHTININKRRRSKKNREPINAWRSGDKNRLIISGEVEEEQAGIIKKDKARALDKPMQPAFSNNNDNSHLGSQCRRRNGRGWRCSQRTLVGYSLCEHHLGKGRLKSINTENGKVFMNNNKKGSKFKELRLLDDSSSVKVEEKTLTDAMGGSERNIAVVIQENCYRTI